MSPLVAAGYGIGNSFELYLQGKTGGDVAAFKKEANKSVETLLRCPETGKVYSPFVADYP